MDFSDFEALLVSAMEKPNKKTIDALLDILSQCGHPVPAQYNEALTVLWEGWGDEELDNIQGSFCIALAGLSVADTPVFRKMLVASVKAVLPPYLYRNPVMKALGVRDEAVSLHEVAARLRRLFALKPGVIVYLPGNGRWGIAGAIDNINASLALGAISLSGSAAVPLETVLKEAVLLNPGPEVIRLVDAARGAIPANEFRSIVTRKALLPVSDDKMRSMAQNGCARKLEGEAFQKYWTLGTGTGAVSGSRRSCDGRSLKEMELLLTQETDANAGKFTADECAGFQKFFTNLKVETAHREAKLLATVVAMIEMRANQEDLAGMFAPLCSKAPFWPQNPAKAKLEDFSIWGEIPAKILENLARATSAVFPEEYLACCSVRLPSRALNAVCANVSEDMLYDLFFDLKTFSADLLLWIWKNRKDHSSDLLENINVENVARALSVDDLPKAWTAGLRELRTLMLDNKDFQSHLIKVAHGDMLGFCATLQGALFLNSSERQSLLVKLSRVSHELQEYLETGAGQRILKAGIGKTGTDVPVVIEPNYTSTLSHKRLIKELDDIINVHVPENREALKVARAHGDFRENSEFDAAKERRNFLSRRRTELERELARVQPVNMAMVKVEDTVIVGCEVELKHEDGAVEAYYLLGAWDGNPDRRFLSYKTRLGAAIINRKVGEEVEVPGGKKCVVAAVRPLAAELIAELDV